MSIIDPSYAVPHGLRTDEFILRPITADDAALDHAALMETRDQLRLWEQSSWPKDDFTVEANRADLEGLQKRHVEQRAFTYTVLDPGETACLGCVYVFPTSATFLTKAAVTSVGDGKWTDVEAVIYFWARASRMRTGMDARLLDALRDWFTAEWKLGRFVFVTNEQFVQQVELIERTDLTMQFELVEPEKLGRYLVFG